MFNTNITTLNNNGAVAIGSSNVTQHVTNGGDAAGYAELARVLLDGLDSFAVNQEDLSQLVRESLEELRDEATAGAPPNRLRVALGKVTDYVTRAGQPILTAMLTWQLTKHGMLPPPPVEPQG